MDACETTPPATHREWQNPLLRRVFDQLAQRLTLVHYDGRGTGIRSETFPTSRLRRWSQTWRPSSTGLGWRR